MMTGDAAERELHGLHVALKTCRAQKAALEHQLAESKQAWGTELAQTRDQRDTLQLRLEAAQNQLKAHYERQSREARYTDMPISEHGGGDLATSVSTTDSV